MEVIADFMVAVGIVYLIMIPVWIVGILFELGCEYKPKNKVKK